MAIQGTLTVKLDQEKSSFLPGEKVSGRATWALNAVPTSVVTNLVWHTEGRGTQDVEIVASDSASNLATSALTARGERNFFFTLPSLPYSFSGKLISLLWAVEVLINQGEVSERISIVVSPTGQEIQLHSSRS